MTSITSTLKPLTPALRQAHSHRPKPGPERVTIVTDRDELAEIIPGWRGFRAAHGLNTPNNEPDRYRAVLDALGSSQKPYIVIIGELDRPTGMIIARASTQRLRFRIGYLPLHSPRLRSLDIVHGGLITDGTPRSAEMVIMHLRSLQADESFEHISIHYLPCEHELFEQLAHSHTMPGTAIEHDASPHWHFELAEGPFENTLARFSRKHRYNIRRADRRLNEQVGGTLSLECIKDVEHVDRFLTEAASITSESYHAHLAAGIRDTPAEQSQLTAAARAGHLRCFLLRTADQSLTYQAGLVIDGTYHLLATSYRPAYAPCSPGQVLLVRVLEYLAAHDIRRIDYGFGDARYKQIYGSSSTPESTILIFGRTWRAAVARCLHRCSNAAARLAKRTGILPRIRQAWRAHLATR